jgi:hypothetical protein
MRPDLPEPIRVVTIFALTFALVIVLGGLAGIQPEWSDNPETPAEFYNRP